MRKLCLKMSISIDGFVAGPNGEADWIYGTSDSESRAWVVESLWRAGVHIMGSQTFKDMAAHWPSSTAPFAAPMNQIPKVLFSRGSPQEAAARAHAAEPAASGPASESWRLARVAAGDLVEEIARLKQEPGQDILAHGGASFAQSLVLHDLVDEYRLLVHPVALGRGLPLFSQLGAPLKLHLAEVKPFKSGAIAHVYTRP
jgi:dihydrofolate reductase